MMWVVNWVQTLDSGVGWGWGWGRENLHGNGDGEFFLWGRGEDGVGQGKFHGDRMGWGNFYGDGAGMGTCDLGASIIYRVTL